MNMKIWTPFYWSNLWFI